MRAVLWGRQRLAGPSTEALLLLSRRASAEGTVKHFSTHPSAEAASVSDSGADAGKPPFMTTAVLVERIPVVLPKPPDWLLEYEQFSMERSTRYRKAYPSDFLAAAAEPPSDDTKQELEEGAVDIHTTTDIFSFYSDPNRHTKADAANDTRSLDRCLDKRLYLLVKSKAAGGDSPAGVPAEWSEEMQEERWRLPEAPFSQQDSLRLSAEDTVRSVIQGGPESIYFIGNAPFAHLTPEDPSTSFKRFFFWARWIGKDSKLRKGAASDFAWFTREEALLHLQGTKEQSLLKELLVD